jgi:O-acetylserine/cysteine efflux transporter
VQVFFTIGLAMRSSGERLQPLQFGALALAVAGIAVIGAHTGASASVVGLVLVILAALAWAAGNIVARQAGRVNMLAYVVWASLFSVPPLLLLSLLLEGPRAIVAGLHAAGVATWAVVLWQSVGNTLFGYTAWGWLLARHEAGTIVPMSLLVPVFGMAASAFWLGEPLPAWKLLAAALVMAGLALNLLAPRWRAACAALT